MQLRFVGLLLIVGVFCLCTTPIAAKAGVVTFTPVTKWTLNYAEKSCILTRSFASGGDKIDLRLEQNATGRPVNLTVVGKPFRELSDRTSFRIRFGEAKSETIPPAHQVTRGVIPSPDGEPLPAISVRNLAIGGVNPDGTPMAEDTNALAALTSVSFHWRAKELMLDTGPLDNPMVALTKCAGDLVRSWGYDPTAQRELSQKLRINGDPARWITYSDSVTAGSLMANIRIDVNEAGNPIKCEMIGSQGDADFAKLNCDQLLKNARFHPAIDKSGKAVASFFITTVKPRP